MPPIDKTTMVLQATSKVSFAKTNLSYPLYAAEFDPYNRGYLVVGGGGGESKTGVENRIVSMSAFKQLELCLMLL